MNNNKLKCIVLQNIIDVRGICLKNYKNHLE